MYTHIISHLLFDKLFHFFFSAYFECSVTLCVTTKKKNYTRNQWELGKNQNINAIFVVQRPNLLLGLECPKIPIKHFFLDFTSGTFMVAGYGGGGFLNSL